MLEPAFRRLDRAKANLQNAKARAAAGLASINDATRATLELATSAREVATAEGRVGTAYLNLGFPMGRPLARPVGGAPAVLASPERTTNAAESFETAPENQVRQALDRRPDLRSAQERTEALRASAKEPLYRLAPTLGVTAQMRVLPDPLPLERGHKETITLNLAWNIFDAGFRYADRRIRVAQAESQALDESQLRTQRQQRDQRSPRLASSGTRCVQDRRQGHCRCATKFGRDQNSVPSGASPGDRSSSPRCSSLPAAERS